MIRIGSAHGCADCGAPNGAACDTACPSSVTVDHELVLAEVDAFEDHMAALASEVAA
jgi:hypothetical protein